MPERQPSLFELRDLYEAQLPEQLVGMKSVHLDIISERETHVNVINNVLGGYGVRGALDGFYDAQDGTLGSIEHPEDSKWIQRGEN